MDISYVLLLLFSLAVVMLLLLFLGYILIYKRHINRVLSEPEKQHRKMLPPHQVLLGLFFVLAVGGTAVAVALIPNGERIASAGDIERVMRNGQRLDDDWTFEIAMDERIAAALAYDSRKEEHTFSVYFNENSAKPDYQFRVGGKFTSLERSVRGFEFEGRFVFLSMNALQIAVIQCHDGSRYMVDPDMPFALIIPSGGVDVYDADGNELDITQDWWFQLSELS